MIAELDPPEGQSYLKMMETAGEDLETFPQPFRKDWAVKPEAYQSRYPDLACRLSEDDRKMLREASLGLDEGMTALADKAINGTSLVLVFQIGSATLLFPGDAQWGTWELALKNYRQLLEEVTFYKVGHHGSHNATPVEFVQQLMGKDGKEVWAMISVNPTSGWPMVPKHELVEELSQKEGCKMARSDKPTDAEKSGFTVIDNRVIEAQIPF
jgi:hypothetical protein